MGVAEDDFDEEVDVEIELVVLDLGGTTVRDDGLVEQAFELTAEEFGIALGEKPRRKALKYVRETMGQSKVEVFRALCDDDVTAIGAYEFFERQYLMLALAGGIQPIPGADRLLRDLREYDVKIALVTGYSRATMDAILDELRWRTLVDITLVPAEVGRGRPYPDLPLTALLETAATATGAMVVVGDTASDMISGVNAGAGLVVGVLTGAHDAETLEQAGADVVLDSVAELAALLGIRSEA